MGYGVDDMWRVWSDLKRKEDELKWGGHPSGCGTQYDSMGRPVNAFSHFNNGWGSEQMGRVNRVRQALNDSGSMAQRMIAQTLSGINLSTIWHILVSACQDIALYYGGSVAAGGFIGGVGGAFFGGVGAVPGAAAGAAAGSYVGGWVLAMLGLKSLVEGLAQAIPEALRCYEKGFREAWGSMRQDHQHGGFGMGARGNTHFAAADLANGHVIMISAILAALVAYLTKGKGDKAALLKEIRQSPRLGPKVAEWVEQNEDKLIKHPALQSRGRGALPREEPKPVKSAREPKAAQETVARKETKETEKSRAAPRVFKSTDPMVGETATAIEQALPGAVKDVNVPIKNAERGLSSDADIMLSNGDIVEVKSGGGKGATTQVANQSLIVGESNEVMVYGPNLKPSVVKGLSDSGTNVFTNMTDLLTYIASKGGN